MRRSIAALVFATLCAGDAGAQVVGRIVGPGATRLQVAVSPLAEAGGAQGLGARFAEVLARNLTLSGYFQVLDAKAYIEGPAPIDLAEINFGNWSVLGAKALVKGSIRESDGSIEVEARLFDVLQRTQIGGYRYRASAGDLPRLARQFADSVLELVTGERGPFDSKIAFASRRAGRLKDIFVTSVDGLDVTRITNNNTINLAPSWSPNAASLVITSYQEGNPSLFLLDLGTRSQRRISSVRGLNLGGRWSPDGQLLALSIERGGNSDIFLLNASGQVERQLTRHPEIDVSPSWSPDGKRLVFVSARAGNPQLYVVNADGSGERRLTFQGDYNTSPCWSPKGDLVAYVRRDAGFNIFTINVNTNQVRQITAGQRNNEDPWFSPDGRYLVFSSTRMGKPTLFLSDLSGAHQVQLTTTGGDDSSPSWSPRLP